MGEPDRAVLDRQIDYYRARAGEYDEWFLRTGRYDRGEEHAAAWFGEVETVERALEAVPPRGACLELACGTGLWTRHLARLCDTVACVDASPEVIAINAERVARDNVTYVQADLFDWVPERKYDFIFFSFWLSHVPEGRFDAFWAMVEKALAPGGTVFFLDNLYNSESVARDHEPPGRDGLVERKLNDGQRYAIVKIFYQPDALAARLAGLGWDAEVRATDRFFIYGTARRDEVPQAH